MNSERIMINRLRNHKNEWISLMNYEYSCLLLDIDTYGYCDGWCINNRRKLSKVFTEFFNRYVIGGSWFAHKE